MVIRGKPGRAVSAVCGAGLAAVFFSASPGAGAAEAGTNLATVFSSLGFDPSASNCATIVQISDIHMSLKAHLPRVFTNVDQRLVEMVNQMNPAPEVIVFTGDFSVRGSDCFGCPPDPNTCLDELWLAKQELTKFTNAPHILMPGNHDTYGTEGNYPHLYHTVFSNVPTYGKFEVKGLKAFYLYGHNSTDLDPPQETWLRHEISQLNPNQQVAVFVHQPPLSGLSIERGIKSPLMESFKDWVVPVWVFAGHIHIRDVLAYWLGRTNIYQIAVSSANLNISTSPHPTSPFTAGFQIICVRDAQVAGVLFGALTNSTYYPVWLPSTGASVRYLFEDVPRPLLLQEEGDYDRSEYEEWCKSGFSSTLGFDTGNWWAYVQRWRVRLPLGDYHGLATHALVATTSARPDSTNVSLTLLRDVEFLLGIDTNNLAPGQVVLCTNQTAWIEIPPAWRGQQSLWLELTNRTANYELHIGGWGLATASSAGWPPPPRISRSPLNPGTRAFRLLATPRRPCWIESSADFIHWVTNSVFSNPSGVIEWSDPNAGAQRFYRVGQPPP